MCVFFSGKISNKKAHTYMVTTQDSHIAQPHSVGIDVSTAGRRIRNKASPCMQDIAKTIQAGELYKCVNLPSVACTAHVE